MHKYEFPLPGKYKHKHKHFKAVMGKLWLKRNYVKAPRPI